MARQDGSQEVCLYNEGFEEQERDEVYMCIYNRNTRDEVRAR